MRNVLLVFAMLFAGSAWAEVFPGVSGVTEIPSGKPGVFKFHINLGVDGSDQAANYVRPNVAELYARMKTGYAPLKNLIAKIYKENGCNLNGRDDDDLYCGELDDLSDENTVLWNYGRGGWMGAGMARKAFITWRSAGSGGFTDVVFEVKIDVGVNALEQEKQTAPLIFEVIIDMTKIVEIPRS